MTADSTAARYERMRALFHGAQPLAAGERAAYLKRRCDDEELRREVEKLLADSDLPTREVLPDPPVFVWEETPDSRTIAGRRSWRLSHEIGRGGLGKVFLAAREADGFRQLGALKVMRRSRISPELIERFLEERRILAEMSHPNVARLLDGGTSPDGNPFLVMELVEGLPIDAWCDRRRLSIAARTRLFATVCDAVHAVHRNLVIHCDLKPSNILVDGDGVPKLVDFGIAARADPERPAAAASRLLTPTYASPEQIRGEPLTTATDVYSLGVVLYLLLAGAPPFAHDGDGGDGDLLERIECGAPPPSMMLEARASRDPAVAAARSAGTATLRRQLRGDLDAIVRKATSAEPGDRYASARELAGDLRSHAARRPVSARRPTPSYRLGRWTLRNLWLAAALAALVAMATVLGVRIELEARRASEQRDSLEKVIETVIGALSSANPYAESGEQTLQDILPAAEEKTLTELADEPLAAARLAHEIGRLYRDVGRLKESRRLLKRALQIRRRELGEEHPDTMLTLGELGHTQLELVELDEGRESLRTTRDFYQHRYGDHWLTSEALNDLGLLELEAGHFDESEQLLEASRAMDRRLGLTGADTAWVLINLASLAKQRGDLSKAAEMEREALRLREAELPPDHPLIATSLNNLGAVLTKLGQYGEAESLLARVLEILEPQVGTEHPYFAKATSNLGLVYLAREDPETARQLFRRSAETLARVLGEDNVSYAISLKNQARATYAAGDRETAIPMIRNALRVTSENLGEDHLRTAELKLYLGKMLIDEDPGGAEAELTAGLAVLRELSDPSHPKRALGLYRLALLRLRQGRPDEAEELLRQTLAIRRQVLAPAHLEIAEPAFVLGKLLLETGRPQEAEPLLREAVEIRDAALDEVHPLRVQARKLWELASATREK
jgi:serine/threonine-protein kinase